MKTLIIDTNNSKIGFKVKHMMISSVEGWFDKFSAKIETINDDLEGAKINFECDVNSLTTKLTERDIHLKSEEFFWVEQYPKIIFSSETISKNESGIYTVLGLITIKGISKEINLEAKEKGNSEFGITGNIKRSDFYLGTNGQHCGKGNALIGEEVKLIIEAKMIQKQKSIKL